MNIPQAAQNYATTRTREFLGMLVRHILGTKLGGFLTGLGVASASNLETFVNETAVWVGATVATTVALVWSWGRKKLRFNA